MADLTMCANAEKCDQKEHCLRHTAKPSETQSYANFWKKGKRCGDFWANGKQ